MDLISQQIDRLCDRFEEERRRDSSIRIEDFLARTDESSRDQLFRELLEIEIELVAEQYSDGDDYRVEPPILQLQQSLLDRFPEQREWIESAVRRVVKQRQIGDYDIIKELGHGGMGVVYMARQKLLNQVVAIKVLSQTLLNDPQAIGRFRREMQLIGRLNHPNIVRALNAGATINDNGEQVHYLVMEFVDGITFQQICDQAKRQSSQNPDSDKTRLDSSGIAGQQTHAIEDDQATLPHISTLDGDMPTPASVPKGVFRSSTGQPSKGAGFLSQNSLQQPVDKLKPLRAFSIGAACEAIRQAALGLQHAHEFGLVHRDVKPANLMLDRNGTVKVLDLGLGKFLDDQRHPNERTSLTMAGTTIGTVDYISPEQCENAGDVDIRADLYSLGCSFYFLLTGRAPYSGSRYDTTRKKLMAHIVGDVPNVQKIRPEVPDELQEILEKMLAKEPVDRFQIPIEVAEALEPFASFDQLYEKSGGEPGGLKNRRPGSTSRMSGTSETRQLRASRKAKPYFPKVGSLSLGIWTIMALPLMIALLLPGIALTKHYFNDRDKAEEIKKQLFNRKEQKIAAVPTDQTLETRQTLEAQQQARQQSVAQKESISTDLAQLPDLNGAWWFNEIPWYLPFVRELILRKIDETADLQEVLGNEPEKYFDPNVAAVYDWLWDIVQKYKGELPRREQELLERIKHYADTPDGPKDSTEIFQEILEHFVTAGPKNTVHPWVSQSVLLHTQALLEHRLAVLKKDRTLAETAQKRYREALESYRQETIPLPLINSTGTMPWEYDRPNRVRRLRFLEFLCLSDSARLEYLATGSYTKALQNFEAVLKQRKTGERCSSLFTAEMRSAQGTLAAEAGLFDDSLFIRPLDMLSRSKIGERMHPLIAQLKERYAWSLLDQWKVVESGKQFEQTLVIRGANYGETNNRAALGYLLHDMHGFALSLRYRGNTNRAVEEYDRVLKAVKPLLEEYETEQEGTAISQPSVSPGIRRFYATLHERAANTRERLADCVLYGGAASRTFGPGRLGETAKLYGEAAKLYNPKEPDAAMLGKQAIMLLLQDNIDEASRILCDISERKGSVFGNTLRTELIRQVADAILLYKKQPAKDRTEIASLAETKNGEKVGNDSDNLSVKDSNDPSNGRSSETATDEGRKRLLRQFLNQFSIAGNPFSAEASRRETLELRLFCAEFLVDQALRSGNDQALQADLQLLLQPLGDFINRPESRPFLRRICDLYVRSGSVLYQRNPEAPVAQGHLRGIVRLLKWMREQAGVELPHATTLEAADHLPSFVVFFLTDKPEEGIVVFYPQDGRSGRLYRLPLSRQQIKTDSDRTGPEWKLDENLVNIIHEERRADRPLSISWNDETSWGRVDEALHDTDWPFEEVMLEKKEE